MYSDMIVIKMHIPKIRPDFWQKKNKTLEAPAKLVLILVVFWFVYTSYTQKASFQK